MRECRCIAGSSWAITGGDVGSCQLAQAELPPDYPSVPMRGIDNGSVRMPLVGIGTWLYNDTVAYQAVQTAFAAGYRHVDTAKLPAILMRLVMRS